LALKICRYFKYRLGVAFHPSILVVRREFFKICGIINPKAISMSDAIPQVTNKFKFWRTIEILMLG